MGQVIVFAGRHARAPLASTTSRASSFARASKVISARPRSAAMPDKASQCADGIPRTLQTLTVDGASESASASDLVPPRASITESDVIMDGTIVCTLQTCQEFANRQPTFEAKCDAMGSMTDPREIIVWRLEGLKQAYLPKDATDQAFAVAIGLDKSTYSSIKKCDRNLSFETGCYIKEKWGISLDWLFYGDLQQSAVQVMANIGRRPQLELVMPQKQSKPKAKRKTAY